MTTAFILMGSPGSGKSTWIESRHPNAIVCSADHFFEKDGVYKFDITKIEQAHSSCLRKFVKRVTDGVAGAPVAVDNTNTTIQEIAPYVALAVAYGFDVRFVRFIGHERTFGRNIHGCPEATARMLEDRLDATLRTWPAWWSIPETVVAR